MKTTQLKRPQTLLLGPLAFTIAKVLWTCHLTIIFTVPFRLAYRSISEGLKGAVTNEGGKANAFARLLILRVNKVLSTFARRAKRVHTKT